MPWTSHHKHVKQIQKTTDAHHTLARLFVLHTLKESKNIFSCMHPPVQHTHPNTHAHTNMHMIPHTHALLLILFNCFPLLLITRSPTCRHTSAHPASLQMLTSPAPMLLSLSTLYHPPTHSYTLTHKCTMKYYLYTDSSSFIFQFNDAWHFTINIM